MLMIISKKYFTFFLQMLIPYTHIIAKMQHDCITVYNA